MYTLVVTASFLVIQKIIARSHVCLEAWNFLFFILLLVLVLFLFFLFPSVFYGVLVFGISYFTVWLLSLGPDEDNKDSHRRLYTAINATTKKKKKKKKVSIGRKGRRGRT